MYLISFFDVFFYIFFDREVYISGNGGKSKRYTNSPLKTDDTNKNTQISFADVDGKDWKVENRWFTKQTGLNVKLQKRNKQTPKP